MKSQKGFSLIELLIVVAVIGIIAAIAVPNLLQSRMAANEASAISGLRTLATAMITYSATIGNGAYAADLGELQTAGLIDEALGGGAKDGYTYTCAGATTTFNCTASATDQDVSGKRSFYVDETAVIRFAVGAGAGAGSDPLGKN